MFCYLSIGMAFGAGSAIARRAVDAVLGCPTVQHEKAASPADSASGPTSKGSDACTTHVKAFQDVSAYVGATLLYLPICNGKTESLV